MPQTMCQHPSHLHMSCGQHVQTTSGQCMSSTTQNLQRSLTLVSSARCPHVVCTSSAHRPRIVRTRLQFPDYFKLNTRGQLCSKLNWIKLWKEQCSSNEDFNVLQSNFTVGQIDLEITCPDGQAEILANISIFIYNNRLIFMWAS